MGPTATFWETLELRTLLSAAFDVTGLTQLRADPAFAGVDGSDLSVAVLDTGLFASHPDIQGNFLRFFDAVENGQNADSDPGTASAAGAYDPPGEGHGTHVAGTVGSTNPEIGVATGTNLIGVRALQAEGDSTPQVDPLIAGLEWVLANQSDYNIRVVNISLGSNTNFNSVPNKDDVGRLIDDLEARGVTVVAAAGNSYGGFAQLGMAYPAVFSTISVANTWEDSGTAAERDEISLAQGNGGLFGVIDESPSADQFSATSQRSTLPNMVAAPGTTIYSTWNGDGGLLYNTIAGTSMASPFVAGTVALMQDAAFTFGGRYLTPTEVLGVIRDTADNIVDAQEPGTSRFPVGQNAQGELVQAGPVQDLPESGQTFKRVDVYQAMLRVRDLVTGGATPTPTPAPTPTPNPTPTPTPTPTDPGDRTDDTNNTLSAATFIPSLNGLEEFEFSGRVGRDGNVNVGPGDIDLYRVELEAPGFPVFDLDLPPGGGAFDPYVRLFDAGGAELTFLDDSAGDEYPTLDTAQNLSAPLAAGTYYLGVSSFPNTTYNPLNAAGVTDGGSTGDYAVTIGLANPDPDGVVAGAATVDLTNPDVVRNQTVSATRAGGRIGLDANPSTANGQPLVDVGAEDVDFFEVVAPDTGRLTIDVDARSTGLSQLDSFVNVYDENLQLVANNDDEDFPQLLDSRLTIDVTQGTHYFVAVTTFQNRGFSVTNPFDRQSSDPNAVGDYEAYFSFDNGDVNGTVVSAIDFADADGPDGDGVAQGRIGADLGTPLLSSGANGGNRDVDFFSLMPTQPGLLQIDATGLDGFNAVLGLWALDDEGRLVDVGDTNGAPSSIGVEVTEALVNHALFVSVTGAGNQGFNPFAEGSGNGGQTGEYSLKVVQQSVQEFRSRTNDSVQNNTPENVAVGEAVRRDVGRDGVIDVGADDVDIYRFQSPFTGTLTVRTDTSDEASADTFLRVFDARGAEIKFNNNATDATTSSLVMLEVTAGEVYYVGVNGASDDARDYDALTGAGAAAGSEGSYGLLLQASNTDLPLVSVSDAVVTETLGGSSQAVFTVTLSEPAPAGGASVTLDITGGTAAAGSDFIAVSDRSVTFAPGETSATVAVTVLGDFQDESAETFGVTLSGATGALILDGTGTGTIANTATPEPTTFAGSVPLTFTPAVGGSPVSLTLKGQGTGKAFFTEGSDTPSLIVLDGSTPATTLTVKGAGALPSLTVNGSLKSLGSKTTSLAGNLIVTGSVAKLTFDDVSGGIVSVGPGAAVTFAADQVQDVSLLSESPVKSIKVGQWLDTGADAELISAPAIAGITVKGAFQAGVSADTLGKVTVGGAMTGSTFVVDQSVAALTVGSVADSFVLVGLADPDPANPGASTFGNTAASIGALTVKGKGPGAFSDTLITAANVGKVSLGTVATGNGGQTHGVTALAIQSVTASTDTGQRIRLAGLDEPGDSLVVGDFALQLL